MDWWIGEIGENADKCFFSKELFLGVQYVLASTICNLIKKMEENVEGFESNEATIVNPAFVSNRPLWKITIRLDRIGLEK